MHAYIHIHASNIPYFLEISPRRHLNSWSSLARRHFEGGQISRAATKVLVTLLYSTGLWASVRIVRYLESRRDFEGGDNSRCGEISRKYGTRAECIIRVKTRHADFE